MSDPDRSASEKRRQLQVMLDAGLVMLHLDPRGDGVIVPSQFKADPVLRLNLAWGFNLPALDVGPEGVYAVLSFNRQNFGCTLPWESIFAMTAPDAGHEGIVWPESVPSELAPYFQAAGQGSDGVPVSLRAEERPRRPEPLRARQPATARAVQRSERGDGGDGGNGGDATDETQPTPPPRPLFIVHEGGREPDPPPPEDGSPAPAPPSRPRAHLRVVKD
ncbi:MAG: hypothetical protein IT385_30365 [Deltaproteobacteria bacterium]|nr:hypothetical protein [Deltaproteobacteria bacterium]